MALTEKWGNDNLSDISSTSATLLKDLGSLRYITLSVNNGRT